MPLIPFISKEQAEKEGIYCSFTDSAADFSMDREQVFIQNIDQKQVANFSKDSNSSYDLRIGSEFWDSNGFRSITEGMEIKIKPKEFFCVKTIEYIHIPKNRFGIIVSKVSCLKKGYGVTTTKIDPGYAGELAIYVFNFSSKTIKINQGDKFCSLIIIDSVNGIIPYDKEPKILPRGKEWNWKKRITLSLVIAILALIVAIIGVARDIISLGYNEENNLRNNNRKTEQQIDK